MLVPYPSYVHLWESKLQGKVIEPVWPTKNGHSIFIAHHSSLITHHSSLKFSHPFAFIIQFLSLNIFHTIHGPHNYYCVRPLLFCYSRTIFIPISISLFLISPSPSALSLSQSRNPNPKKCLNLPRLVSTIITGEQRPSLRRVQRRDLAVVTHFLAAPTRKPKPIKISFLPC